MPLELPTPIQGKAMKVSLRTIVDVTMLFEVNTETQENAVSLA